jgi:sugar lactone lactonase YvrE
MDPMSRTALLLLLAAPVPAAATAQADPILESRAEFRAAAAADEARDWGAYLAHATRAQALRPEHGGVTLALASARALTGDTAGAIAALAGYATRGYAADIAADSDFAVVRASPDWPAIAARLARNAEPVARSTPAFTLAERGLLAEGIAWDPEGRAFYVASVRSRKIYRVGPDGGATVLADSAAGLWAPMGMRVDPAHRRLWVATAAVPQMVGYTPADSGRSAVVALDLGSGAPRARFEVSRDGAAHVVGDLTIGGDGRVYATDSRAPTIYRVPLCGDTLERFVESPLLLSAQGLAAAPDGRTLYVADYARGIIRVDLKTRKAVLLPVADPVLALGIDALSWTGAGLVGVQNGVTPQRVVRLTLDDAGRRIVRSEVLDRAHPAYDEPTLSVVAGDELYYIADGQWERFGEDGSVADSSVLRPTVVLRLRL